MKFSYDTTCVFCLRANQGQYDFTHGAGTSRVVSFEPLNPVTPGHRLFVPANHVEVSDVRFGDAAADVMKAVSQYRWFDRFDSSHLTEDFNLILNGGPLASQTIAHMHWHYIPRRKDDGLILPWTNQHKD